MPSLNNPNRPSRHGPTARRRARPAVTSSGVRKTTSSASTRTLTGAPKTIPPTTKHSLLPGPGLGSKKLRQLKRNARYSEMRKREQLVATAVGELREREEQGEMVGMLLPYSYPYPSSLPYTPA